MLQKLKNLKACEEAIMWLSQHNDYELAWNECERGDWLLWLVAELDIDHRRMTLAKAQCAELVIHLMEDERSIEAIEIAKAYGKGEATKKELDAHNDVAYDAASDASDASDAAHAAAYAAAHATSYSAGAYDAYDAAAYADAASDAAAYAAAYAASASDSASDAAKNDTLKNCANIVRDIFTFDEVEETLNN